MESPDFAQMRAIGQRYDYLSDIAVLKAAGIDYVSSLEGTDRPAVRDTDRMNASSETAETFWNSSLSEDDTKRAAYDAAIEASTQMTDTVSSLVGTVNGYRLGHFTEGEVALYKSASPANQAATDVVLEIDLYGENNTPIVAKFREIPEALGRLGCLKCALSVLPEDRQAIAETVSRIGDVIGRMGPGDNTISVLPFRDSD